MPFVNKYTSPEIEFNHANEFLEGKTSFVYSIGNSEKGAVIVKSNEDGSAVWEKVVSSKQDRLQLLRIVQVGSANNRNYIVSAFNGQQWFLLSISSTGTLNWMEELLLNDPSLQTFLVPASDQSGFYFGYSCTEKSPVMKNPVILKFNDNGKFNLGTELIAGIDHKGFLLNSMKNHAGGLVLVGTLLSEKSRGIILNLTDKIVISDVKLITQPAISMHDIIVSAPLEYIVSGHNGKNVIYSHVTGVGNIPSYSVVEATDKRSLLTMGKGRFFLTTERTQQATVRRIKLNMLPDWAKALDDAGTRLGVKTVEYQDNSKHLTLVSAVESLIIHDDEDLESCVTIPLDSPAPPREEIVVEISKLELRKIDVKIAAIEAKLEDIQPTRIAVCDEDPCVKDEVICALYEQLLALYTKCFGNRVSASGKIDLAALDKCALEILDLLLTFDKQNPKYQLSQELKDQFQAIQNLLASSAVTSEELILDLNSLILNPRKNKYALANQAIKDILAYLLALGNCDCGQEDQFTLTDYAALQSAHLYLQSAGSVGDDSTDGVHLRWLLRNGLENHLPKGNYAIPNINFNKNDDFVRIYRAPYKDLAVTVDLSVAPNIVDDANSLWLYSISGFAFYVYFRNTAQYASVRTSVDPSVNPSGFIAAYGSELIEIENKNQLSFATTPQFSAGTGTVEFEVLSVLENKVAAPKKATLRKVYNVADISGVKQFSENIRSARFVANGVVIEKILFEFYAIFLDDASKKHNWEYLGKYALTKDTNVAYFRLEPQANIVHGKWLRYNDQAYVNVDNYKARWNSNLLPVDERIVSTVDKYIDLSDNPTNPQAIETIYFNDPNAVPIPGYEPDDDFDPSENQFELSNLYVLKMASLDYHIARMLGLGILDIDPKLNSNNRFVYMAEYVSFGDLNDGLGARQVQHLYCSLPTSREDQRLPIPVDLKAPVPGIFQGLGTEAPSPLTDANGYSLDGKTRFLSLFHEELPDEDEDAAFFYKNFEFVSSEGTLPVYAGIEYKLSSDPDWVKPELPYDKNYYNIDVTVPVDKTNETRSVLIPEQGYPVFVHREKQSGWHDYSSYGINWFSRATSSPVVHSIETIIKPTNLLLPPVNINAVLIRQESPLLLTSADEQIEFGTITSTDKTFIRLTFDYNHGQELIDYHKEINGEQIPGYFELPDNEELFAEDIDIYFRKDIPNSVSGKILSVADDVNPILAVITTEEYPLPSQGPGVVLTPEIPVGLEPNFIGSALSVDGVSFIIHQIDNSGTYPVFTVFKNDLDGFPVPLSTSIPAGDLTSPDAGGMFIIVENMLTPASWDTPNPLSFKVNIDQTDIHTETVMIHVPDGTHNTHVQKFRGVYENALIEKVLEDDDGNGIADVHLGLYKLTFSSYVLAQHSQAAGPGHRVVWNKGAVRVHTDGDPNGQRRVLNVIRTENIGTTSNLIIYAADSTFDGNDPNYDQVAIGTHTVNYYPGYKTYLYEDATYGLTEGNTLPGPDEDVHYSIFGLRSNDWEEGFHSKISAPVLMYAQKIEDPLAPRVPVGGLYATRPDFYGKSTYTFTTIYDHKPHAVQFGRASDIQIMTALWATDDGGDPGVWTVSKIREQIFENGNADWYTERWQNVLGFDYSYPGDPANDGQFERFPDPMGTSLPLPNSENLIDSINAFIDRHNDFVTNYNSIHGTSIPTVVQITVITDLYQVIVPASAVNAELKTVDFIRDVVHNCFVPLTEIPIIYNYIKGLSYKPIPKKQVVRDGNGNLLNPNDPAFDMAPMMKIIGPDASIPTTDHQTQFTDFGIDGASNAKYFYVAREFSLQMKAGPHSPILGPINLVNTAPPKAPEIVKVTPILENRAFGIEPQIELRFNGYVENQNIKKINVYRAISPQQALSVRTMDLVNVIDVDASIQGQEIWSITDNFSDLGYVPYGDPLFYMLTVSREVKYNDKNEIPQTEYQPSEMSKMTITNIVENYNPESPVLTYYSDPLSVANELNSVTFKWSKTVHNGKYALQKRNEKGNWITLKEVKSNADEIILQLQDTDWGDDTLVVENADGNPVYHVFKIVATNFAGMISRDEKLLSIYDVNTWNDISGL